MKKSSALINLPQGYGIANTINLKKDRMTMIGLSSTAILIGWALIDIMDSYFVPLKTYFDPFQSRFEHIMAYVYIISCSFIYAVCHEFVHGGFMKLYGIKQVFYGFNGIVAYAGNKEYIYKKDYNVIALAPLVILGIILLILNVLVRGQFFWLVYVVQVFNVAGSVGDVYVVLLLRDYPDDTLVKDEGTTMRFYTKTENTESAVVS